MFREGVLALCQGWGVEFPGEKDRDRQPRRTGQGLGEYCRGKDLEECRKVFGKGLASICAKCPE